MEVTELSLAGVKIIRPRLFTDERGFFLEHYRLDNYINAGIDPAFLQDNHSFSKKSTIRGMHFQRKPGQAKLVSVIAGEIFDVVVDIRPESPTFGQWEGVYLNGTTCEKLFIPVGFAHGFCVISDSVHVLYKVSSFYDPMEEKGFRFDDPMVSIEWPEKFPILSPRDKENPSFAELFKDYL